MKRKLPKILIATTNQGKLKEIMYFLKSQPFEFVTLNDLDEQIPEPEETGNTVEANAIQKAEYYGKKSGLITIADDTGLFINALDGWPGIRVAKARKEETENFDVLLGKMKDVKDRSASFRCATVVYDPEKQSSFVATGELPGKILEEPTGIRENKWGYNRMFFATEIEKAYGEVTLQEKISFSHRSRALIKIKYFLDNQYGSKHLIVPLALIVKDGKILMGLRNDPHNPEAHNVWEFFGGNLDFGENPKETVIREAEEESGYKIEVVKLLQHLETKEREKQQGKIHYQVLILPYVCRIVGGEEKHDDLEVLETKWFDLDEALNQNHLLGTKEIYNALLPELKQIVKENNL